MDDEERRSSDSGAAARATTAPSDSEASADFSREDEEAFVKLTFSARQFIAKRSQNHAFRDYYKVGGLVGSGGFGKVYSCIHKASGHERAVKVVPKSDSKANKSVRKEFEFLAQLDHPNLCRAYELFEDEENLFIVTDLYEGGDLFELVREQGPLKEHEAAIVMQQLLSCIHHCHENNVVHRDLKMENILLQRNDFYNLKVIDFGLSKQPKTNKKTFSDVVGSVSYLSPQMLDYEYNLKCDIWALGVVAYVLLCGRFPFEADKKVNVIHNIASGLVHFNHDIFDTYSKGCTKFIRSLLTYKEEDRPNAKEALRHPWLETQTQDSFFRLAVSLKSNIQASLYTMKEYKSNHCKLKQVIGALIAAQFLCQRERIESVFLVLDRGCYGKLSAEALQFAYWEYLQVRFFVTDVEAKIMTNVNVSGSGMVECSEFSAMLALQGRGIIRENESKELVKAVFNYLDIENKGHITPEDLQERLELDLVTCRLLIAEVSKRGIISRDTFFGAVLSNAPFVESTKSMEAALARNMDFVQAQARSWSRSSSELLGKMMGKSSESGQLATSPGSME